MRLFLIFSIFFVKISSPICYDKDVEVNGRCFQFNKLHVIFDDATLLCQQQGYHLASIHSDEENAKIIKAAQHYFPKNIDNYYYWIGLFNGSLGWEWEDGTPVDYFNWYPGFPDSTDSDFDYVLIKANRTQWQTTWGKWKNAYVCSYPTLTSTTTAPKISSCQADDLIINNRCYSFNRDMLSQEESLKQCQKNGKTLAIFDNFNQTKIVSANAQTKFQSTFGSFWIGLQRDNSSKPFYWQTENSSPNFTNWYSGYPYCGQLVTAQDISNTKWRTFSINTQLFSVCSGLVI